MSISVITNQDGSLAIISDRAKFPGAQIPVVRLGSESTPDATTAVFRVGNVVFETKPEQYSTTFSVNPETIKDFLSKGKTVAQVLLHKLESTSALCNTFSDLLPQLLPADPDCKPKLFRTLSRVDTTTFSLGTLKVKKASGQRFSLLEGPSKRIYINLGVNLIETPVFKVIRVGMELNGKQVVIVKANRKHPNPSIVRYAWNKEISLLRSFILAKQRGVDMEGLHVPLDILNFPNKSYFVSEKLVTLSQYLKKNKDLTTVERLKLCFQLAKGLNTLHTQFQIAHMDLKSINVLCDDDGNAEIIDFGIYAVLGKVHGLIEGTLGCIPPETYVYKQQGRIDACINTELTDSWDLGILIYRIMMGRSPDFVNAQCEDDVVRFTESVAMVSTAAYPQGIMQVAKGLLQPSVAERRTVRQSFPIITQIYNDALQGNVQHVTVVRPSRKRRAEKEN